mmetsp:Transcript_80419/g.232288  ORF Transcript_80419/g.232288 Transcript_80419/m.232288 type:complete len:236 (+) Transcript_80419:1027-1734(+)
MSSCSRFSASRTAASARHSAACSTRSSCSMRAAGSWRASGKTGTARRSTAWSRCASWRSSARLRATSPNAICRAAVGRTGSTPRSSSTSRSRHRAPRCRGTRSVRCRRRCSNGPSGSGTERPCGCADTSRRQTARSDAARAVEGLLRSAWRIFANGAVQRAERGGVPRPSPAASSHGGGGPSLRRGRLSQGAASPRAGRRTVADVETGRRPEAARAARARHERLSNVVGSASAAG